MRNWLVGAALSAGFALLQACSSIPTVPAPTMSSDGTSWSSNGLPVHTALSATKDSIVYGGVDENKGNKLYVVALDPATGVERWRRLSDVSGRIQGVEQAILTDDDTAYFLARSPSASLILVAVMTATGEERWHRELEANVVDPDVMSCGDAVCIVTVTTREEMWRISKADGHYVSKNSIAGMGVGYHALLAMPPDSADALLLMASHPALPPANVVYITLFRRFGETKAWSKPASELFGETPVSPDGGWNGMRVDDGWIVWLGREVDYRDRLKTGDAISPGVVAGFDDEGRSRWIEAGLHICWIFKASTAAGFCDGESRVISATRWELRPNLVQGLDPITGTVTWKLDLNGEIDEFFPGEKVLRIDENRYLVDIANGRVLLDVGHGPEPAPQGLTAGWCMPDPKADWISRGGVVRRYAQARNAFPCRLGGDGAGAYLPALPIPEFAGVNVSGWGAWVEDGRVRAKRQ